MMKKVLFLFVNLLFLCTYLSAQEVQKSDLQQRAEAVDPKKNIASARSLYIHAFNDYANKGQIRQGVECAVKATALYYKENFYKEAFDLLRRADQTISASKLPVSERAAAHYLCTKERFQMYMKLRKSESIKEQLNVMESQANQTSDETVKNDLLYNKAIYYYTFGMNAQGNAVFKEMADKLTSSKEYDKVDEVYQTLIANGRRSNNANMVAQSYSNYLAWKDSTSAIKHADEIAALKKEIADDEAAIAERDSSLTTRWAIIIGLGILAAALAAALIVGAVILMRFIFLTRKQKKVIKLANESNALKAKFISNISAQLEPTFKKLDSRQPEVKALLDFSNNIQTLSELENKPAEEIVFEDTQVQPFCEGLMDQIRDKVKSGVQLTVTAQKMSAPLYKEYVSHILHHLLENAAIYTPEGGNIHLEFKKRGPHSSFLEIHNLTEGDGLGLPICKQMALKMNGDLEIDPQFTKGTRFILDLHA